MAFSAGDGASKSRAVMSEINVTPLVDVMLVLLIIFMVTAPMMHQGIDVELPETTGSGRPTREDPFLVVIDQTGRVLFGERAIGLSELRGKIEAIFQTRRNKEVYIQADRRVEYGTVAFVMAEVKAAGIKQMSLVTLPKER